MFELSLICPQHAVEQLGDALDALDALSVSVEDADAQTDAERALFGEPGNDRPRRAAGAEHPLLSLGYLYHRDVEGAPTQIIDQYLLRILSWAHSVGQRC